MTDDTDTTDYVAETSDQTQPADALADDPECPECGATLPPAGSRDHDCPATDDDE